MNDVMSGIRSREVVLNTVVAFCIGTFALLVGRYFKLWQPDLSYSSSPRKKGRVPGLYNMGNTCFVNSMLQAWASCDSLSTWLKNLDDDLLTSSSKNASDQIKPENRSFLTELNKLLKVLNSDAVEVSSAAGVLDALRCHGWIITPGIEQDCQELMDVCFSTIEDELLLTQPIVCPMLDVLEEVGSNENTVFVGGKEYYSLLRSLSSAVVMAEKFQSPFRGLLAIVMTCELGHEHVKHDVFNCVPLSLVRNSRYVEASIDHSLRRYFASEVLSDVTCDACSEQLGNSSYNCKRRFQKKQFISKFPKCLLLSVHRVGWSDGLVKNAQHISFPEVLDLRQHSFSFNVALKNRVSLNQCSSQTPSTGVSCASAQAPSCDSIASDSFNMKHKYRLCAVIQHVGGVYGGGHFVAYRRTGLRSWQYTSDDNVRWASADEVFSCQAYALFYERIFHKPSVTIDHA